MYNRHSESEIHTHPGPAAGTTAGAKGKINMVAFYATCCCCGHEFPAEPEVGILASVPLGVPSACSRFLIWCPVCKVRYWWLPGGIASPEGWYAGGAGGRLEIWPRLCDELPDCVLSGEPI